MGGMMNRKLVLLDGTAALYRAFYAIAELSTSDGRPTNALFGFIRILFCDRAFTRVVFGEDLLLF